MDTLLAIHLRDLRLAIDLLLREEPGINVIAVVSDADRLLGLLSTTQPHLIVLDRDLPDQPPVARINAPSSVGVGENFIVDASDSKCATNCVSYAWDMGDGRQANAVAFEHVYQSPGDFNVILVVTDDKGLQGTANQIIQVVPGPEPPPIEPEPSPEAEQLPEPPPEETEEPQPEPEAEQQPEEPEPEQQPEETEEPQPEPEAEQQPEAQQDEEAGDNDQ